MSSRMIGDFRVRCDVVEDGSQGYQVLIWTRRVGGNAPEKSWTIPGQQPFATRSEAEQHCLQVFEGINGVRFNGEPEFAHTSA
ncbi:hypothetical protein CAL18_03545 [Bordetella genomosp. 7]|uniref:Uncharacterized protein n=1 Tax=Bordetella genomosp. 7 TaxID=1416805 RepID=A0A261RJS3_9BORD|nr:MULTISPECIES: hypothetical protein [Bordetella]OZI25279.1 hypothetical protein CAL19_03920 [Bordetella genomosp. 7]OZI28438.1 hypothetical protein CAL18_03545 [Bordetella genomosp. 7]